MTDKNDKLLSLSHQLLDDSLDDLDDSILARLRQSRLQAVNTVNQKTKPSYGASIPFPSWLAPVSTGATFATIALMTTLFWFQPPPATNSQESLMEDIHLLSQSDELELYQNMEFYLWLEDETSS